MFTRRDALAGFLALGAVPGCGKRRGIVRRQRKGGLAESDGPPPTEVEDLVIGSGYGGSILARRLAEAGNSVVVLERGQEWWPGDFPKTWGGVLAHLRDPTLSPHGLLELISDGGLDVVCGAGLGGTSLLNAAICMRPDRAALDRGPWPSEIRALLDRGDTALGALEPYYARAAAALRATTDPDVASFTKVQRLGRVAAARSQALGAQVPVEALTLAITHTSGVNPDGVTQSACIQCGDCCTGCNVGAKNVLTTNYIPRAKAAGARFFTGIEVRFLAEHPAGGWTVETTWTPRGPGLPERHTVRAKRVFLGAGSAGTTRILLQSREQGLALSDALGTRLGANGDVLGIAYNSPERTDNLGFGPGRKSKHLPPGYAPGQIITSNANYRAIAGSADLRDHFNVLDGAVPMPSAAPIASALATYALTSRAKFPMFDDAAWERVRRDARAGLDFADLHPDGAINHSMLYLACGHDASAGRYVLKNGRMTTEYEGLHDEPSIRTIEDELRAHAAAHGAAFVANPRSTLFDGQMMATHPLGGAPMGDSPATGVADAFGRVFRPDGSARDDLYVTDGALVPTSLGATPLLTISALAERIAENATA